MKCPECGFASAPESSACTRCGRRLTDEEPARTFDPGDKTLIRASGDSDASPLAALELDHPGSSLPEVDQDAPEAADAGEVPTSDLAGSVAGRPPEIDAAGEPEYTWQDEIAERVARFRRRRSNNRESEESPAPNLEFNFSSEPATGRQEQRPAPRQAGREELDVEAEPETAGAGWTGRAANPIERVQTAGLRTEDAVEWALDPEGFEPATMEPVKVVLDAGSPELEDAEGDAATEIRLAAPLGRRLAAGVIDILVLLAACGVFTAVFWTAGGKFARPTEFLLIVLGCVAAFFVAFYFSLFTALAFATPGQASLGLCVRTLEGMRPDSGAAVWRGVGYLVSAAPLMLGFIWAALDIDGLTWHDRMSGTCLAELEASENAG